MICEANQTELAGRIKKIKAMTGAELQAKASAIIVAIHDMNVKPTGVEFRTPTFVKRNDSSYVIGL